MTPEILLILNSEIIINLIFDNFDNIATFASARNKVATVHVREYALIKKCKRSYYFVSKMSTFFCKQLSTPPRGILWLTLSKQI